MKYLPGGRLNPDYPHSDEEDSHNNPIPTQISTPTLMGAQVHLILPLTVPLPFPPLAG